jgi:hypothetical protein
VPAALRMLRSVPFRVRSGCGSFSGTSAVVGEGCRIEADLVLKKRMSTDEILLLMCDDWWCEIAVCLLTLLWAACFSVMQGGELRLAGVYFRITWCCSDRSRCVSVGRLLPGLRCRCRSRRLCGMYVVSVANTGCFWQVGCRLGHSGQTQV